METENKTTIIKKSVKSGISFGSALAMVISYSTLLIYKIYTNK